MLNTYTINHLDTRGHPRPFTPVHNIRVVSSGEIIVHRTRSDTSCVCFFSISADCINRFEFHDQTMSRNGVLKSAYSTLEECKTGCLQASDCEAIDYSQGLQKCYFHTDGYLNRAITPVAGIAQYRRLPCSQSELDILLLLYKYIYIYMCVTGCGCEG